MGRYRVLYWNATLFFVHQCFDVIDVIDTNRIRQSVSYINYRSWPMYS